MFLEGQAWAKKGDNSLFDVTMGSYDGAEACELVGALILTRLTQYIDKADIGLYRDNGIAVLRDTPGPSAKRKRKDIIGVFKSFGSKVKIEVNLKAVNYLDVTLDLESGKFQPY